MTTQDSTNKIDFSQLVKTNPDVTAFLKEGDFVEAILIVKNSRQVFFDLGKFGTGVLLGAEFAAAKNIIKPLAKGEKISAKVVELENENGMIELSLADAHQKKNWQALIDLLNKNETVSVKIVGANSGGLIANLNNIRAFLPLSQLSAKNYPIVEKQKENQEGGNLGGNKNNLIKELQKLVNVELLVKIIDLNPRTNKLIISERTIDNENISKLLENYKIDDEVDVIISGFSRFGIFVRFKNEPSIEGFIHISELDHKTIDSPKDVAKLGETVKVKILEINGANVNLSLKALKSDPWEKISDVFQVGQSVEGRLIRFNPFGAAIDLPNDFQGLIHVSEFGSADEMKKQLADHKPRQFIISNINPQEKRIALKLA